MKYISKYTRHKISFKNTNNKLVGSKYQLYLQIIYNSFDNKYVVSEKIKYVILYKENILQ